MDPKVLIELFGYLGSTMVVVSMLMASVVKLRVINTIGSVISGTYALIIGSFPLALMNICLIAINVYNLWKLLNTRQEYDLVPSGVEDPAVRYFLERHMQDICRYFPDFQDRKADAVYMVYCDGNPAGILLGDREGDTLEVFLDYSAPAYRDCGVGKYLYSKLPEQGLRELWYSGNCADTHGAYLLKMGFRKAQDGYRKVL